MKTRTAVLSIAFAVMPRLLTASFTYLLTFGSRMDLVKSLGDDVVGYTLSVISEFFSRNG